MSFPSEHFSNISNRLLFHCRTGATAIEYGLIAAGISIAIVVVVGVIGTNLTATFQSVADNL